MFKFFYDSLDTVKQLKKPSKKEVINTVAAVFIIIILAGLYFLAADGIFSNIYKTFYHLMS